METLRETQMHRIKIQKQSRERETPTWTLYQKRSNQKLKKIINLILAWIFHDIYVQYYTSKRREKMPTCSKKGNSCDNIHAATARDRIPEQFSCLVFIISCINIDPISDYLLSRSPYSDYFPPPSYMYSLKRVNYRIN